MADIPIGPPKPPVGYARDIMGQPVQGDPEAMARLGNKAIGEQEALSSAQAAKDLSYVDQNWGTAGTLGMGALSGLTLGLGPGALAQAGLVDPGHIMAAQTSPLYTAGDIGGMVLPGLLTGGESVLARATPAGMMGLAGTASERLAARLLPESAGVMGRLASTPIRMAARGATESALMNLGHTAGDALVQNKPLSAEAMWASGVDGALGGGLIGAGMGTVGSLASQAVESMGNAVKGVVGKTARGEAYALKSLGLGGEDLASAKAGEGGLAGKLKSYGTALEEGGSSVGDTSSGKLQGAQNFIKKYEDIRMGAVKELEEQAASSAPDLVRAKARTQDIVASRLGTGTEAAAKEEVDSFWNGFVTKKALGRPTWNQQNNFRTFAQWIEAGEGDGLKGVAKRAAYDDYKAGMDRQFEKYTKTFKDVESTNALPASWTDVVKARDEFALKATTDVRKEVLNVLDSEIRSAMEGAGVEGAAEKYASATQSISLGKELESNLGKKVAQSLMATEPAITARDVGTFAGMAAIGHPLAGAGWISAKGIGRIAQKRFDPWMAQMAYNHSVGAKAAEATVGVQQKIAGSLKRFFKNTSELPYKAAQTVRAEKYDRGPKIDRAAYEAAASKAEQLISENHQDKVRRYAESVAQQGYTELAGALMGVNQRAVQYLMWNMPPRQGGKAMNSLRPIPISDMPTMHEFKFIRQMKGLGMDGKNGPLSILDDLENGSVSREQVQAFKYTYPELHSELVATAAQEIADMKSSGRYLPVDKIASLSLTLDAPLDSIMRPEFIGAVQTALNTPPPETPPGQPPAQPANVSIQSTGLLTQTQQLQLG